jgi:hypothetical protein
MEKCTTASRCSGSSNKEGNVDLVINAIVHAPAAAYQYVVKVLAAVCGQA